MNEVERIVDQYDRAMNGESWHGDPVWKVLEGVSPEQAAARPVTGAHNIWELVEHIIYWETVVCRRLNNMPIRLEGKLNFPATPAATDQNWAFALAELRQSNADFRDALSKLQPSQLDQPLSSPEKTVYVEVHGVIQHNLYHAGQIALLSATASGAGASNRE